jgi:hypothetical protein
MFNLNRKLITKTKNKMKKASKTNEKLRLTRLILIKNFGDKVTYSQMNNILKANNLHEMNFYYFVYAGCLKTISKGVYVKTSKMQELSIEDIHEKALNVLAQMREKKKSYVSVRDVNNALKTFNAPTNVAGLNFSVEEEAIMFLKNRGYKILKEVKEFKEM